MLATKPKVPDNLPEFMRGEDGNLADFMTVRPTENGELNFVVLEGIGDVAWVIGKFWKLCQDRDVKFYFHNGVYNRLGPYLDLMGIKWGYTQVESRELLSFPGEFEERDFENGGTFYIHCNRHIEEGKPLHNNCPNYRDGDHREWFPWMPFKNPIPPIRVVKEGERTPHVRLNEGVYQLDPKPNPYIMVHMGTPTFSEGNLFPRQWARILQYIENNVAPVKLIGAKWDENFMDKVCEFYEPKCSPCIGQSLATALSDIANSRGMFGIDNGTIILATYMGLPTMRLYPRWLRLMPGTWEDLDTLHPVSRWVHMDEAVEEYKTWFDDLTAYGL